MLFGNDDADLLAEYDISFFMDDDMIAQYVLHPTRRDSLFEVLTIAFEDCKPAAISILDSLGQRTRIEFHDLILNAPVEDETFRFTAPDGVDVIDDRCPCLYLMNQLMDERLMSLWPQECAPGLFRQWSARNTSCPGECP